MASIIEHITLTTLFDIKISRQDLTCLYAYLALIIIAICLFLFARSPKQKLIPGIPIVGGCSSQAIRYNREAFRTGAKEMLQEGYTKTNGGFFYVPSPLGERLMIPTKYLEELKSAPVDHVDFVATFIEMFEGKYTTMGSRSTLHPRVVKAQLNQNLADVMPAVQKEVFDAVNDNFPMCDEWTKVPIVPTLTQIVARVSSAMFGGTTLSHNKPWVNASINFAIDGFNGAQKIKAYPEFLKLVVAPFIAEIRNIRKHYQAAENAAIPLIMERRKTNKRALDLLSWMDDVALGEEKEVKFLAGILLKVSFAAIHTSAAAPAQLLFDLCARPHILEELRDEIVSVTDENGTINKNGFRKMIKMDSWMKEAQRFNPLLLITFERVVSRPLRLSCGTVIPAHTTIGVPTHAITMDPTLYPDPSTYDPWRFAKSQNQGGEAGGKAQYVATNSASLGFGYGRHACPGRFFATQEIKAIMAHILMTYDVRFSEGQSRPGSLNVETQCLPHPHATLEFRRRR